MRFLRPYQLKAIYALQRAVKDGKDRFLFEMATGTGKTLTAAAIIKLFLRTGNAHRVLFLVDRTRTGGSPKAFGLRLLSADFQNEYLQGNRDDWRLGRDRRDHGAQSLFQ
ncbi:MAG: DEAD/DEAH box helicase family protein [Nitrospirales bacterium]|nr:DEAD/DEAH box helicase family protein [Nitrospirales bacterium]